MPRPTLSFHLSQLTGAGLLEDRKEGRSVIYAARLKGISELLEYLIEDCCQGEVGGCAVPDLVVLKNCKPLGSDATGEQK